MQTFFGYWKENKGHPFFVWVCLKHMDSSLNSPSVWTHKNFLERELINENLLILSLFDSNFMQLRVN